MHVQWVDYTNQRRNTWAICSAAILGRASCDDDDGGACGDGLPVLEELCFPRPGRVEGQLVDYGPPWLSSVGTGSWGGSWCDWRLRVFSVMGQKAIISVMLGTAIFLTLVPCIVVASSSASGSTLVNSTFSCTTDPFSPI
ncbi:hypothetical protein K432DRAFT_39465 [Lepidopterella palustris CBS 459.81]|uniref:Uncharacterized protein n=1 Tax=Lepidopterella palustris CBS 459.81 TaxID=1314670 RepID=A0A8E2EB86_9PEZI|nr:hypothetical protein K432DRAFT_39465 [Lepidopterella palustris CBS 459.81]